jgi:alpha-glucosidase
VRDAVEQWPDTPDTGWPSWAFENHDAPRAVSRWASVEHRAAFARMKMLLLVALRGNIFLYQGEELGLTQVDIPFARLQDPEAIANWPLTLSRDGARTPMPWVADAPQLGFSSVEPWLPIGADHARLAVDVQGAAPESILKLTRDLLALRSAYPALQHGEILVLEASDTLLVFERRAPGQTLVCVFNLGADSVTWRPADPAAWRVCASANQVQDWHFGGYGALIAERVM